MRKREMRKSPAMFLLLLLLLGTLESAQSQKSSVRKEVNAAYAKIAAALKRKDIEAAMKFYTSDFTRQDSAGARVDRAGYRNAMLRVMKSQQSVHSLRIHIDNFRATGKTVTVTTTTRLKARIVTLNNQDQPVGRVYEMTATWPVRDVWMKTAAGWRIKNSKMLAPTKATMERP